MTGFLNAKKQPLRNHELMLVFYRKPPFYAAQYHPTQKPIDLMAWLIRSYTDRGQTVLDFTAGSGTTGLAAAREGRKYICIEREQKFCAIAEARIAAELPLLQAAE